MLCISIYFLFCWKSKPKFPWSQPKQYFFHYFLSQVSLELKISYLSKEIKNNLYKTFPFEKMEGGRRKL